jgi:hypothetical protein
VLSSISSSTLATFRLEILSTLYLSVYSARTIDLLVGGRYELTMVRPDGGEAGRGHAEAGWNAAFDKLATHVDR